MKAIQADSRRFAGLDAIRFVCAYIVVIGHSPSFVPYLSRLGRTPEIVGKILRDTINGPAAVIVFFVISGFCIHWPYRNGERIGFDYFVRRYIRIGIPLCAALLVSPYFGLAASDLAESVLWSLYCELVYYSIYPLLVRASRRVGWRTLTAVTFLVAFSWAIASPTPTGNYSTSNVLRSSVFGLPCWLMGCHLAESQLRLTSTGNIWRWRCAVFLGSILTLELRFHTRVHFDLTLNFFGILVLCWLLRELEHGRTNPPWSWLERAGAWSYSLYIMHPATGRLPEKLFPSLSSGAQWLLRIPLTLGGCYLFYLAVERPSHRLARFLANALRGPVAARVPPLA